MYSSIHNIYVCLVFCSLPSIHLFITYACLVFRSLPSIHLFIACMPVLSFAHCQLFIYSQHICLSRLSLITIYSSIHNIYVCLVFRSLPSIHLFITYVCLIFRSLPSIHLFITYMSVSSFNHYHLYIYS